MLDSKSASGVTPSAMPLASSRIHASCWRSHRRAGGRPELRSPSRTVLQVLRLTGVVDLFDVVAA